MQARGLINYRLKYFWLKVICCIFQPNQVEPERNHRSGELWPT